VLTLLTSLTLAFLGLTATEPTIAANLKRGEVALALAEAGIERAIWALTNPGGVPLPAAAPYDGQQLSTLGPGAYTIAITAGATPNSRVLVAHGYAARDGVAFPAQVGGLAQADIAAHRVVQVQVTAGGANGVGGPATPNDVSLPGALTVAGTLQMSGNSMVNGNDQADGTPNSCAKKGGVTIRDKTLLSGGGEVDNTITLSGSASAIGTPSQQELGYTDFSAYTFNTAQLAALKALAQTEGTYIQPTSNAQFNLEVVNGLMFVDTVNGQPLGNPPDPQQLANVKINGANNSGWLIVIGSIRIDGNVTYNGFIYAHNDLTYKGTGNGGLFGAVLTGNAVDTVATVVDSDASGNSKIYYDCNKVANGGGALSASVQDSLNRVIVTVTKGTWREVTN
ncbi:MAG: hypothetical protein ACREKH_02415, partial [Candidatus Rokuibacteriota bacterium]